MINVIEEKIDPTLAPAEGYNIRNFRKAPEVEHFYRFIHDNDLRKEARLILEAVLKRFGPKRGRKKKILQ